MTTGSWLDFGARRTWAALFAVIVFGLVAVGYGFYQVSVPRIHLDRHNELAAIGKLKAEEIAQWRQERLDDATKNMESPLFRKATETWLKEPGNLALRNEFIQHLKLEQRTEHYADALLLDPDGHILLAAKDDPGPVDAATVKAVAQALEGKQAVLSDLFRSSDGNVYIDAVASVSDANNRSIAMVVLRSDAKKYLYPLVQSWPIPCQSAESVLFRKDGDDVLFLSELRDRAGAALSLRIPLTRIDSPVVQAVQGKQAMFEGKDYRGVEVLADLRPVPGSAWFMITKEDRSEILAEVSYRAWICVVFVTLFILLTVFVVAFLYGQRQARLDRDLYASQREKYAFQELLRATLIGIADGVISTDRGGGITFINPVAQTLTGWPDAEALGKPLAEVFHIVNVQTRERCENPVEKVLASGGTVGLANDGMLIARDGTEHQIADSGAPTRDTEGNILGAVLVFRDVTEAYRMQETLRESEERYRTLFDEALDGICLADAGTGLIIDCNKALAALADRARAELIGQLQKVLHPPSSDQAAYSPTFRQHLTDKEGQILETQVVTNTGIIREVEIKANHVTLQNRKALLGVFRDITERKRAEERLARINACLLDLGPDFRANAARLTALCGELLGATCALYNRLESGMLCSIGQWHTPPDYAPQDKPEGHICYDVIRQGGDETVLVRNLPQTPYVATDPNVGKYGLKTYLGHVVRCADEPVGSLCVVFWKDVEPTDNDKHILSILASALSGEEGRRRAEAEVESSRDYITNIVNAIGDPVFVKDDRHRFVLVNDAECTLVGRARTDLIGKTDADFFRQEQVDVFWEMDRRVLSTGQENVNEEPITDTRTGETRTVVTRKTRYVDPSGNRFVVGTIRDITGRKRAEEALRETNEYLENLFNYANAPIIVWDRQFRITRFNYAFESLTGRKTNDVIGESIEILFSPALVESSMDLIKRMLEGERWETVEIGILHLDGSVRTVLWNSANVLAPDGKTPVATIAQGHDVTERKRAEEALRKSEMLNRSLVEHLPHRVFIKDRSSVYVTCNANYARDVGIAPEQIVGKDDFALHPPELAEKYRADDQAVMTAGATKDIEERYQAAGEERWIHTVKVPYHDEQGRVIGVLGIFEDVTERRRAGEERDKLQAQLIQAQKMEAVGQLAGGVAHDFNNILQAMVGYSSLLLDRLPEHDETHEFAEEIAQGAERAAVLTRQLLAFSRRQILEMEDLDLNDVVQGLTKMIRRTIGEDVEVEVTEGRRVDIVHADRGQMEQVLLNLCLNARDAMPEGGVLTIGTENVVMDSDYCDAHAWASPGRYVLLDVTDTGCGMDAQTQARIFEPFFSTKELGKGTGLGLATVYGIVRQHQGMIQVYSEVGKGTTFKVYLPSVERMATTAGTKVVGRARGGAETILLAEDDEALRKLAARILESAGYTVLLATNGEEALEVFQKHAEDIDLLLLDVVMPKMGGKAVYDVVRQQHPHLRFLFSSGYSTGSIHTGFVLKEGIELIQKPHAPDALLRKVREVLDRPDEGPASESDPREEGSHQ